MTFSDSQGSLGWGRGFTVTSGCHTSPRNVVGVAAASLTNERLTISVAVLTTTLVTTV